MEKENILGTEKIGKLLRKFAIPCVISMLVNSIYNMVDQIFIGWGVGYLGNGATNIIFPINIICLAFALMLGDGTSAYLSLKLGEKKKNEASRGVVSGILTSIVISVIFFIIIITCLPLLINIFGCTDSLRPYALEYGYALAIGLPFMMVGTTLNSVIRADGSPKYSMISMVSGAILNIILDPIFIFILKWGVKGAAIATAISQILTFILNICYVKKFKSIQINKKDLKIDIKAVLKVASLGISSFITQMSFVIVMAVENNLLNKLGTASKYGSDIPITVLGIVLKINQILNSIIIGIAVGSQPIIGYNYGAGNAERVKSTLKRVLGISIIVSTVAFILFQSIPDKLISIFGSGNEKYMEFACLAFRRYLLLVICNGIQIPSGIFFQAIGKAQKSAVLSLSRQIIFLVPAMLILGNIFGIEGILFSGPVADGLSFIIAGTLIISEVRKLGKSDIQSQSLIDDTSTDNILLEKAVITVSREYGSGGRYIAKLVADKLGIKFYDKDFIKRLAQETGLSEEYIEENEQKRKTLDSLEKDSITGLSGKDTIFIKESELIQRIAQEESCVIVGRCADFILKENKNATKVFIYNSEKGKIERATKFYKLNKENAQKEIKKIDKQRANHYKYYTGRDWKNYSNYDICINSDTFGVEGSADMICDLLKAKINKNKQQTHKLNT